MRKGIALALALLMLFMLSGCAGKQEPAADNASIVVGFSQLGSESSWRIANTVSMEQAAKEAGFSSRFRLIVSAAGNHDCSVFDPLDILFQA